MKKTIERRIGLLFAGFLLCFTIVAARAVWLQGVQGAQLASEAAYQQTDVVTVPGLRGSVLDRYGNPLAVSEDAATIYATPYQVKNPPREAEKLATILGEDPAEVLESLTVDSGFSYVAHKVDLPTAARIARLELPGIGQLPDSRRSYPQGDLAAQVIGAVGSENQGLTGLEAGEESILGGTDGERRIVKDALGEPIRLETVTPASDGEDIQLTLDPAIQKKTEEALAGVGETWSPKGATAIVMDPRTSQLLAIANWPPVDPANLEGADPEDLLNRATGFTYEPGSTFKAFTVSAALEEKLVTPETAFTLPPQLHVADRIIEDAEARPTVTLTVAEILAHSSNVGAATIGLQVGSEKFSRWIDRFGFGRPTGVEFPARGAGHRARARRILRLDDGQPADRPGTRGDADADDRRLRRDRQRRHPATPAADREGRRRSGARAEGAAGDQAVGRLGGEDDARGRAGAGRDRLGGERPRLHARGQDRYGRGGRKRRLLEDQVRRLLHRLRAGAGPAAARRGDRRPAAGRNLRRLGGGAGVRPDRGLRACRISACRPNRARRAPVRGSRRGFGTTTPVVPGGSSGWSPKIRATRGGNG